MKSSNLHKQALFFTIINYAGTAIGIISALFIYPLDFAFSGTIKFIDTIVQLLYPIMVLGASHALIRFYPLLETEKRKHLFNYSVLSIAALSIIVLGGIILYNLLFGYEYIKYIYIAFPIGVSLAFVELFRKQAQDIQKLALPTLYEKIIPKVVLPVVFLLLVYNYLQETPALLIYMACYILILLLIGFYIYKYFKPGFTMRFKPLFETLSRKDYYNYSLYSFAASLGSLLAFRIDGLFIFNLISEEANGIYGNGSTMAATLQVPAVGLFALYAPLISDYIASGNMADLKTKYRETARLLFFIGGVLLSCIYLGIDDLFSLLPAKEALKETIPIIYILGFSVLLNIATGFNTEMISYSKYYRFNMITIVSLIFLNVGLNFFFIYKTDLGITGVAYASLIAMAVFNIAKLWFIKVKFGMLPFDRKFMLLALVFVLSGIGIYLLPDTGSHLLDLIYKTGLSVAVNVFAAYRLKLVYQVNVWIDKTLRYTGIK
ncbi:polysaccharide biosynthesis C-terminal domain-containing protein [Flavobacterium sp.]|uniref:lipopolysaccharide biosynthesis protein n=1 Tax=Flavobacterium sp. TaxID=239 RepID=UPI00260427DE|nr:polysaccharide biosynthesis C-terminal domain-containing protein [Flavobacterium sp.]